MKQVLVFLLVLGALIIGALTGYFYQMQRATATHTLLQASSTYSTLRDLRSGDTNAVFTALEADLDMSVVSLRAILNEHSHAKYAKNYTNLLRRVAEYRSAHPYHNGNSNIDAMVTEALNSVIKTNH